MPLGTDLQTRVIALLLHHRCIVLKVADGDCRGRAGRAELAQQIATPLWRAFPNDDPRGRLSTWM
ncbi:RNA polymerase ECF-type sigma factor [Xanthomonas fragariae]|uniref:RNA polymerase ECF-type sigma factor n=1 Tax=Xanthomonas fragariae TaxID=48664 RepID=A0A1Y6H0I6_9XANT|nr:hypothetical protein BER92_13080 [Xanthomonas fragariae]ENZ96797.1 RNA polymerase ECF-type sigma factor [Xanthomonas fragariae LMG 25863]AOD18892.1 hypothetical protein BER93_13105 [Xanthomonas fragariae]MBL9196575.1 hypothetical protein [Xanthomonas fragariae]MBL9221533.1 hypothetical protein [Xanthomonas fragariae]